MSSRAWLIIQEENSVARKVELTGAIMTFGRGNTHDIVLRDLKVSRQEHARILKLAGGEYELRYMDSTSPVLVNGEIVSRQYLKDRDEIRMGDTRLTFHLEKAESLTSGGVLDDAPSEEMSIVATVNIHDIDLFSEDEVGSANLETLKQAHQRLALLYELSQSINSKLEDWQQLLDDVLSIAFRTLKADQGCIVLLDDQTGELNFELVRDKGGEVSVADLKLSHTMLQRVLREGISILASNALDEREFGNIQSVVLHGVRSVVCAPLTSQGEVIGLIYLDNRRKIGSFSEDDLAFLTMLAHQAGMAIRNARLHRNVVYESIQVQRERDQTREALIKKLEKELETAHKLQMGLMPKESPEIEGFDIAGICIPANHVGGDFFQYFPLSGKRLAISIADVTGHAMEAAIPVVMFSGILDTQMQTETHLEDLFVKLNHSLHRNLDARTFICFTMGELDPSTRCFRLANGGCPYAYHYRALACGVTELQVNAYPLGVRVDTIYPVIEVQLEPSDRIVFCSDGIIEAENGEEEFFGFERTAETIRRGCRENLSTKDLLERIIEEVKSFTGDMPQGDDQTVVVLGVKEDANE